MKLTPEIKAKIDAESIYELLHKHRFAPIGSPDFQGEVGEYRVKRLAELRDAHGNHEKYVTASKQMGW